MASGCRRNVVRVPMMDTGDVRVDRTTDFGNPFILRTEGDRADVVLAYADWLRKPEQLSLRRRMIRELRGKRLACWCYPKMCHADVIDALVNR